MNTILMRLAPYRAYRLAIYALVTLFAWLPVAAWRALTTGPNAFASEWAAYASAISAIERGWLATRGPKRMRKSIHAEWRDWLQEQEGSIGLVLLVIAALAPVTTLVTNNYWWLMAWPADFIAYLVIDRLNFNRYLDRLTCRDKEWSASQ